MASSGVDCTIREWDLDTGSRMYVVPASPCPGHLLRELRQGVPLLFSLAVPRLNRRILFGGHARGVISVTDLESGIHTDHVVRRQAIVSKAEPNEDGTIVVAVVSGRDVIAFDVASFQELWRITVDAEVWRLVVHKGTVIVNLHSGRLLFLDVASGIERQPPSIEHITRKRIVGIDVIDSGLLTVYGHV